MHVLIIGGGIGGLALAQALKKSGIQVSVFERDSSATARPQGYSIYLTGKGATALRACLPKHLWDSVLAMQYKLQPGLNLTTDKLDMVFSRPNDPRVVAVEERGCIVDRSDLRRVLLTDLDENIYFNKTFVRYEHCAGNKVTVFFSDGTSVIADLLVGADGVHSLVRNQLLGIDVEDTGVFSIVANTPLTNEMRELLEGTPLETTACVSGPDGSSALVVKIEHNNPNKDHLFWVVLAKRKNWQLKSEMTPNDAQELLRMAAAQVQHWHPVFKRIIEHTDLSSLIGWPLMKAVKTKSWTDPAVTLLGDAIHCMPPTLNMGGNTALRDADILSQKLVAVELGKLSMAKALHEYTEKMMDVGYSALDKSMRVLSLATPENETKRRLVINFLSFMQTLFSTKFKLMVISLMRNLGR